MLRPRQTGCKGRDEKAKQGKINQMPRILLILGRASAVWRMWERLRSPSEKRLVSRRNLGQKGAILRAVAERLKAAVC
jgi:hypothetical protein